MKKLITIMASMATCLLFGDGFTNSGTSFEEYGENAFAPDKDDTGATGETFWYTAGDANNNTFVLSNYTGGASANTPDVVSRPDYFAVSNNSTFLSIDTGDRLYRSAIKNDGDGTFDSVAIPANGIYLDTLVKFTAAEDETGLVLEGTDKIAIAYVEHEDLETPENSYTNFFVRAGYLGSSLSQTNYVVAVPANFDKDAWHRLTVRSFARIDEAGDVGFVVYLDEVPLQYGTAVDAGPSFTPSGAAAAFYTSELHALYPSAVPADQLGGSAIAAVAFTGNGSVDDVTFTTETPNFIKAGEAVRAEITLGTGVTDVTVTVAGTPYEAVETNGTTFVFNFLAGTTSFVLGVTADSANGYTFDETTGITPTDVTYDAATDTVTITGSSPALTVKGTRNNVTYIDGEDQQQSSPSLATALAAAKTGTTITLAYGVSVEATEASNFAGYNISGKSVRLDLNGKTITWNDPEGTGESLFNIATGAELIVIDSSVSNTGKIVYGGEYGAFNNGGKCYVGAASGDYGPTIEGILYNVVDDAGPQVVRGKFDKASNSTEGETPTFIGAADYIESGSELKESLGDYWVVAPEGGSSGWEPDTSKIDPAATAADTYSELAGTALATANAKKLTEWAVAKSIDFAAVTGGADDYVDAFLLNCAPDVVEDEKDDFVLDISFDSDGNPVITPPAGKEYNVTIQLKGSNDLSTWTNVESASKSYQFFKAVLAL